MKNAIYNPKHQDPDEELFTVGMRNLVLQTALPSLFGSLMAILVPHLGQMGLLVL